MENGMANRRWTVEQKRAAVERMASCGHDKLAAELKVGRRQLYAWRAQFKRLASGPSAGTKSRKDQPIEQENRRLQAALANKVLEVEFPAEYSLASCSPAEPASASSAALMLHQPPSFVEQNAANGNLGLWRVSHDRGSPQSAG